MSNRASSQAPGETEALLPQHRGDERRPGVVPTTYHGDANCGTRPRRRDIDPLGEHREHPVVNKMYAFGGVTDLIAVVALAMVGWHMSGLTPYHHEIIHPKDPTIGYPYQKHVAYPERPWQWIMLLLIPFSGILLTRVLEMAYPMLLHVPWMQRCLPHPRYDVDQCPYMSQRRTGHSVMSSTGLMVKEVGQQLYQDTFAVAANAALLYTVVETLKVWSGKLRPDFMDRCEWDSHEKRCTGNEHLIVDGMKAFPSGHAAYGFGGMTLVVLMLFHTFRPQMHSFLATLLCLSPLVWAGHISATRFWENRHDVIDTSAGAVTGILVSMLTYRMFCAQRNQRHTRLCCPANQHDDETC